MGMRAVMLLCVCTIIASAGYSKGAKFDGPTYRMRCTCGDASGYVGTLSNELLEKKECYFGGAAPPISSLMPGRMYMHPIEEPASVIAGEDTLSVSHKFVDRRTKDAIRRSGPRWKCLRSAWKKPPSKTPVWTDSGDAALYEFHDAAVTPTGTIVSDTRDVCQYARNAGCGNLTAPPPDVCDRVLPMYESVVVLSTEEGARAWHFVMEALTGWSSLHRMAHGDLTPSLFSRLLVDDEVRVHVSKKTPWVVEWLRVAGVDTSRVIEGTVFGERVYVPRAGRCGFASYSHLQWLRKIMTEAIFMEDIETQAGATAPPFVVHVVQRGEHELINSNAAAIAVSGAAARHGSYVKTHDYAHLGSLVAQASKFANCSVVVGSHGLGNMWSFMARPQSALVELLPYDHGSITVQPWYAFMTIKRRMSYIGLATQKNTVDVDKLWRAVDYAFYAVSDSGEGVPDDTAYRLFGTDVFA